MNVVLLATGGTVAASKIRDTASGLRRAAGEDHLRIHLVSWGGAEPTGELTSSIALGPYPAQRSLEEPGAEAMPSPAAAAPLEEGGVAGGQPVPGEPEAVASDHHRPEAPATGGAAQNQSVAVVKGAPGRLSRDISAAVWRVRYGAPYQFVRRAVRGGTRRRFARKAPRSQRVLGLVRSADVVVALDVGSIPAAWQIAKAVPGPPVVHGAVAGERVLRRLRADGQSAGGPSASTPATAEANEA